MTTLRPNASDENFAELRQYPFFDSVIDSIVDYRVALFVSASRLAAEAGCTADEPRHPIKAVAGDTTGLANAGGDGVGIDWFVSDEGADDRFFDLSLDKAIRPLAERLVETGRGPCAQYHNRAFAAHVLGRTATEV